MHKYYFKIELINNKLYFMVDLLHKACVFLMNFIERDAPKDCMLLL